MKTILFRKKAQIKVYLFDYLNVFEINKLFKLYVNKIKYGKYL